MQQPRGSVGRTRFLLALSLSTVTAVAVAAPLALQAVNGSHDTDVLDPAGPGGIADDQLSNQEDDRSLEDDGTQQGGIGAKPNPKALSDTGKAGDTTGSTEAGAETTVIPTTTSAPPVVEEGTSGRPPAGQTPAPTETVPSTTTTVPTVNPSSEPTSTSTSSSTTTSTVAPDPGLGDGGAPGDTSD